MTLTGFLIGFILLMGFSIAFIKILDSRAIRVLLMTRETHRQEVEMEKESQKSRQRMLEEIQNPDLVMETIIKMKRGEEVSIPLAAFDYIYRNLNKFTLIDKVGKITIVNQEDYFKFKEKALSLMKNGEEKTLNIEEVLKEIQEREAKKPIEITKHEDGTVIKTDHVARRTEIIKPNGEKVIINHKTDTMTSINLVEEKETKEDAKALKEANREKDKKIKALEEENKLNRAKIKETKEAKKTESIPENSVKKNQEETQEYDEEIYNNIQELENEINEINDDKIARKSTKANSISTVPWKQGQLLIEDSPTKGNEEAEEININIEEMAPDETKPVLYPFEDLQSFLKEIVHFKEDSIITQMCVNENLYRTQPEHLTALNAYQTHNDVISNAHQTHTSIKIDNNKAITPSEVTSNADVTQFSVKRMYNSVITRMCVDSNAHFDCENLTFQ